MTKRILLLLALCISGAAFAGNGLWNSAEGVDAKFVSIDPANGLRMLEGEPFTGEARTYHPNGDIKTADSFVNGMRDGPARIWFPDGKLGFESHFVGGTREGISRTWWANGKKRSYTAYENGKQQGEAWVWYSTGEKYKRHNYQAGVPVGLQQGWRKNGKLFDNFEVRGDRTYGLRNSKICYEVKEG